MKDCTPVNIELTNLVDELAQDVKDKDVTIAFLKHQLSFQYEAELKEKEEVIKNLKDQVSFLLESEKRF